MLNHLLLIIKAVTLTPVRPKGLRNQDIRPAMLADKSTSYAKAPAIALASAIGAAELHNLGNFETGNFFTIS